MRDGGELLEAWRRIFERRGAKGADADDKRAQAADGARGARRGAPDALVTSVYWRCVARFGMLRRRR